MTTLVLLVVTAVTMFCVGRLVEARLCLRNKQLDERESEERQACIHEQEMRAKKRGKLVYLKEIGKVRCK